MSRAQAVRVQHPAGTTRRNVRRQRTEAVLRVVRMLAFIAAMIVCLLVFLAITAIGASMQKTPTSVGVFFCCNHRQARRAACRARVRTSWTHCGEIL